MKKLFGAGKPKLSPEEKKELNKDRLLLVLSGAMLGISFPPFPFPLTILMFFAFIPYFYVIEKRKGLAEIGRATYITFFIFSLITLYWVGSWQKQSDPFLMIAGGVLVFFNPLLFLIPSTLFYITRKIFRPALALFLFPLFWVTYEYLYTLTDLHFPWLILGHGLAKFTAFIQAADIVGAVGLSIIVLYINIFLYKSIVNWKIRKNKALVNLTAGLLIFVIVLSYGFYRLSSFKISNKTVRVGLIQPNLNPWEKWQTGDLSKLTNLYLGLSQKAVDKGAKIIFWPETAYPVYLLDGDYQSTVDTIYKFLQKNNVYLLTGMPDVQYFFKGNKIPPGAKKANQGYYYTMYNGILLLSPHTRRIQRYGKMKLVPFGEHVPFADQIPFLSDLIKWGVGISGWNVGRDTTDFRIPYNKISKTEKTIFGKDSLSIDGVVCFESVFPYFITNFVRRGAEMISVLTNDSWYGNSSGPYQHNDISILRAVENRRSVVRAANGGISSIISPLGRVKVHSKMFTKTFIVGDVPLENTETFFTKFPLIIPILSSVISLWIFGIFILKKMKTKFNI